MDELIKRLEDAVFQMERHVHSPGHIAAIKDAIKMLKGKASVELVRCKECKYCLKEDEHEYWCNGFRPGMLVTPDDYCSHGIKTEDPHETHSV